MFPEEDAVLMDVWVPVNGWGCNELVRLPQTGFQPDTTSWTLSSPAAAFSTRRTDRRAVTNSDSLLPPP
jgi:hypothetical protein